MYVLFIYNICVIFYNLCVVYAFRVNRWKFTRNSRLCSMAECKWVPHVDSLSSCDKSVISSFLSTRISPLMLNLATGYWW